ncbi:MAG: S8 family serine peptidase [Acidobacteriota bacterium]
MIKDIFSSANRPEYHENTLIVKLRPTAKPRRAGARALVMSAVESPGLSALSTLERGGLIKRVTALSRPAERRAAMFGARLGVTAMLAAAPAHDSKDANAGVHLIEMEKGGDTSDVQTRLASDPNVEFVSRVPVRYLVAKSVRKAGIAKAAPPTSTMWNLAKILWKEARAKSGFKDANQIRIAVLDTGIDPKHPDLKGRVKSYTFLHPDIPDASGDQDLIGHGTHVSGTITALINNKVGINGICACQLLEWKIFTDIAEFVSFEEGFQYFVDPVMYRRALADCLDQGVDVINLSIGGPGKPDHQEQTLFDALLANGTTIVAAMGNEREEGSPTSFPAAIKGVIAVGATSIDDTVASFSNRGNHIVLSAPGVGIWSTVPTYSGQFGFQAIHGPGGKPKEGKRMRRETNYDSWDGTSMATPHVTAAVGLLLANRGKMSPADARAQLTKTADKVKDMGKKQFHPDYGAGRLNLLRLLTQ